ncbi:MAG: IPT/TIG domain-containing protein, partial [Candidatus Methanofastidiosia archaeon]
MFGTKKTLLILFCIGVGIVPLLAQPTLFEARSGPDGAIMLKWNGSGIFSVYRNQEDLFDTAEEIAQVQGTSYTDYPDTNGAVYYYWVCVLSEPGDESPPSPSARAVCDREAPSIVVASPLDGAHIHGALTVEGTASDGETGVNQVEVSINGVWYKASGTSTWQLSVKDPPEGEIPIVCRAHDKAGNSVEESIIISVESVPPSITGITPKETVCNTETTAVINGKNFVDTPQVVIGSTVCDVTWNSDTKLTVGIPPLNEGVYDVTVINPDGKSDTLSAAFSVYVPNEPPEILSVHAVPHFVPNNGTTTTLLTAQVEDADNNIDTVVIDLTPINGGVTFMKDDGLHPDKIAGDLIYSAETVITKDVAEGEYKLLVTATDEYGAVDTAHITITVVEDPPDNPPELTNYQVLPSSGTTTTIFRYTVTYSDEDNNSPTYVQITITGVGTFNMVESDPGDHYYVDGKTYYYEYAGGLPPGTHSYTISASDGTNPVSIGATGPDVSGSNTPPVLTNESVAPTSGTQTTNFRYKVTYTDADNDDPVSLVVDITGVGTFNMVELDPADNYYKDGKVYYYDYTAGLSVGTHSYTITADDGTDTTSLGGTGPTVTADSNTPPVLTNESVAPTSGTQTTNFRYKVTYTDADN